MKIDNIIEAGGQIPKDYKPSPYSIDQSTVINNDKGIQALTQNYIFSNGKPLKVLDGSVQADIVVNAEDKAALNTECEETNKLLNEERETRREMLFRQARVLYPEKEEWTLSLAIDAYMEQQDKGIDITTYKFDKDAEKY
jgi:thioredoxin-like negative regulator of GroEL